MEGKVN